MNVRDKLKVLGKDLGLNQKLLAARIGVSEASLSRWMDGSRSPNASHLLILSMKFPKHFKHNEVIEWLSKKS